MKKECFILRGVPGAGKSTIAKILAGTRGVICEADKFMVDSCGLYSFDPRRLSECHLKCFQQFKKAVDESISRIVLSNTNIYIMDFREYYLYAKKAGYKVHVLVVENHHNSIPVHPVPQEKRQTMAAKLKQELILM